MLSPAARRLRRMVALHEEIQAIRARLIDIASAVEGEMAQARTDVLAEERAEQAQRAAGRMGLNVSAY